MTKYVDDVLNPYIAEKRMSLNLSKDYPALAILRLSVHQLFSQNWITTISMWYLYCLTALIGCNPLMSV